MAGLGASWVPGSSAAVTAQDLRAQLAKERRQHAVQLERARAGGVTPLLAIRIASIAYAIPERDLLAVARCESRLNPMAYNRTSSASGLFQFLPSTWRAYPYGRAGLSVWNPLWNALQAAHVRKVDGSFRQWVCQP